MLIEKYINADENNLTRNPYLYYPFLEITKSITPEQKESLKSFQTDLKKQITALKEKSNSLKSAASNFMNESKMTLKTNVNRFSDLETLDDSIKNYRGENLNYIVLMADTVEVITSVFEELYSFSRGLNPPNVLTDPKNKDTFAGQLTEIQLNGNIIETYINHLASLSQNNEASARFAKSLLGIHENYFRMLLQRHSVDGVKIIKNPVITDIGIRVFSNIDSHGEIESGKDEISAYTLRKAEILASALKDPLVNDFISSPDKLISFVKASLRDLDTLFKSLNQLFSKQNNELIKMGLIFDFNFFSSLEDILSVFDEMNPSDISYIENKKMITETEKMQEDINNETLEEVVKMLLDKNVNYQQVIKYIISRKKELKKFFHEENSFYICKIGAGNPFMGEAPGALSVVPAEKPKGDIKWILGSGYDEVREFAESIKSSSKYHALFLATSPSKTADKSNILLIGPPGCGKTEVMRAVAANKDSIAIFAQGSDFLTCWKGEAEKNPKRLFEEGLKLSRESGKHVHFLIDEIDSVLNNDQSMSSTNLTLEFQILMDGVVRYPNLSVWGATNHPERIPMPMMRRFNKSLIVGELASEERVKLLKHFLNFLPLNEISNANWEKWASQLDGSTGDIIRKVADLLWREKLNWFVNTKPEQADEMLSKLNKDGQFNLDKFDRDEFNKELKKYVFVSSDDIQRAIDHCLHNVAIKHEIETAVRTYKRAKELLNELK